MKKQFVLLLLLINLAGCAVFRPATRNADNLSAASADPVMGKKSSVSFIQNISTDQNISNESARSPGTAGKSGSGGNSVAGGTSVKPKEAPLYRTNDSKTVIPDEENDGITPLQFKYAILTNSPVEELTNQRLLVFMDQWYGVRYHYGGSSKDGIDCSAFASLLLSDVYKVNQLPRMSADQYQATRRVPKKNLREGDLVFFHTLGKGHKVTHVGVYLYNNRFVHASIAGVQISDLGEGYYLQHYVGAGRAIDSDRSY